MKTNKASMLLFESTNNMSCHFDDLIRYELQNFRWSFKNSFQSSRSEELHTLKKSSGKVFCIKTWPWEIGFLNGYPYKTKTITCYLFEALFKAWSGKRGSIAEINAESEAYIVKTHFFFLFNSGTYWPSVICWTIFYILIIYRYILYNANINRKFTCFYLWFINYIEWRPGFLDVMEIHFDVYIYIVTAYKMYKVMIVNGINQISIEIKGINFTLTINTWIHRKCVYIPWLWV